MKKMLVLFVLLGMSKVSFGDSTTYENPHYVFLKNGCIACHGSSKSYLGISYKGLMTKYQGELESVEKLKKYIREGGRWNKITELSMPAQTLISDEEISEIVDLMVGLNPKQD